MALAEGSEYQGPVRMMDKQSSIGYSGINPYRVQIAIQGAVAVGGVSSSSSYESQVGCWYVWVFKNCCSIQSARR